jgi:pyridinium-3,5-biscarboxylic acid mononucleotide sulfurtransferase
MLLRPPLRLGVTIRLRFSPMTDLDLLRQHLAGLGKVLLGYSGGVDSALLAVVATEALGADRFLAAIGRSPSYPEVQWRAAVELAARFHVPLLELDTRELDDPRYLRNDTDRCYFCKTELWSRLGEVARRQGFDTVIDGTNADDLGEHRPGLQAGRESDIRSPLAELGWTKDAVRAASRELDLPTWNSPAAPCLSSRVRYGLEITAERLRQVEDAEAFLRSLGVAGDLRVRHHGRHASIEVTESEMTLLRTRWKVVERFFVRLGFDDAELDPQGYRRGRLLALAPDGAT